MTRAPSRTAWAAFAALAAVALAVWAVQTLVVRPQAEPNADDTPRTEPKPSPRSSEPPASTPRPTAPEHAVDRPTKSAQPHARSAAEPLMGDSLDPDRLAKARQAFVEAMNELDTLDDPTPQRISEIYLKGHTAIERMEDEARGDPQAEAAVKRDLARLRAKVKELTADTG